MSEAREGLATMINLRQWSTIAISLFALCGPIAAMGQMSNGVYNRIITQGRELFHSDVGCWVCHSETGAGLVGPTLHFGPTPLDIYDQLQSNPIMGVLQFQLQLHPGLLRRAHSQPILPQRDVIPQPVRVIPGFEVAGSCFRSAFQEHSGG